MQGIKGTLPLLAAMTAYREEECIPFHTPGHKYGRGMHPALAKLFTTEALAMDVSLMQELDDFFSPTGCIKEAQERAARVYGAGQSFFIVNGTTAAIHAMLLAAVRPGGKVIVARNAHRSVLGGLILAGANPVFVATEADQALGIAGQILPSTIEAALAAHPDAQAILVTTPNYYGGGCDLAAITALAHARNIPVLVDEAHGPHLGFDRRLPASALSVGADLAAQSTHKLLGALTQASILQVGKTSLIAAEKVSSALAVLQTTSPNYWLLASLDAAVGQLDDNGNQLIGAVVDLAQEIRERINAIDGLFCFGMERIGTAGLYSVDLCKITVTVSGLGLTGVEAERILRRQSRFQVELVDQNNVLLLITLGDSPETATLVEAAMRNLAARRKSLRSETVFTAPPQQTAELSMLPREAFFAHKKSVAVQQAVGMIAAEPVTFYPPGIPVLLPGERISREILNWCLAGRQAGLYLSGPQDEQFETIQVVEKA